MKFYRFIVFSSIFLIFINGELVTETEKAQCLQKINGVRKDAAKNKNIANMNRLVLDKDLELLAEKEIIKPDCGTQLMSYPGFEAIRDVDHSKNVIDFKTSPGKSRFACIRKLCSNPNGPLFLITDISNEQSKSGSPGSECSSGKLAFEGLCYIPVKVEKVVEEPETTTEDKYASSLSILIILATVLIQSLWN